MKTANSPATGAASMIAAECEQYGAADNVVLRQRPIPQPAADQVLLRTLRTTVSAADSRIRTLVVPKGYGLVMRLMFGICRPRQPVLGTEMVGEVVAVGAGVSRFRVGDVLVGYSGSRLGCHAEYRLFAEHDALIPVPAGLTLDEAAGLAFGGMTAVDFLLNKGQLQAGQSVLILGAAGAVGTAAVQIAAAAGARVTAVCRQQNAALVRSLGAAEVIDYQQTDPLGSGVRYDLVLDVVGGHSIAELERVLCENGKALLVVSDMPQLLKTVWHRSPGGRRVMGGVASEAPEVLEQVGKLAAAGSYRPVVGDVFPLQAIIEAHRLADSGHKRGNAVIQVAELSS